jgi:hypothetical protein
VIRSAADWGAKYPAQDVRFVVAVVTPGVVARGFLG